MPAALGNVSVSRKWSVAPAVVEPRFESAIEDPMTARDARTDDVVPLHVYVNAGLLPDSVHATEHLSMTICKPFVASVSSSEVGDAVVVSVTDARLWLPEFVRSKLRCIVSPGTIPEAFTVSRFVAAPVAPNAIVTVPEATVWLADVVLVNVAKVPKPAMLAAAPITARESRIFFESPRFWPCLISTCWFTLPPPCSRPYANSCPGNCFGREYLPLHS